MNSTSTESLTTTEILTLVGVILTFLLNIYQSVKQRHFESDCGCCHLEYDSNSETKKPALND